MSQKSSGRATTEQAQADAGPWGSNQRLGLRVALAVVVALGLAIFLAACTGEDGSDEAGLVAVEVIGETLPTMPDVGPISNSENDPAAGLVAPTLVGTDYDGNEVKIEPDGRAKAIYYVAHWCPHCQAEVPVVQELIDTDFKPENLDIYAVSTAVDPSRENYPPETWLENENFTPQVLRDDSDLSAYNSAGPAGFPFVVYLDEDHQVVARSSGVLGEVQMRTLWDSAAS